MFIINNNIDINYNIHLFYLTHVEYYPIKII